MKQGARDKRNYVIIALVILVLFMTVGFAAFSTNLQINGTAGIASNWCVGFDNRNTSAYVVTKGKSTGTSPTGTMTYSGTACSSYYVPTVTLASDFYQPGDKIVYTLTIANKSSLTAAIKSITVDGTSVTSNQTKTKGNIIYTVEMPEATTLASNATTTMKVTAEFQNTSNIGNTASGESQSITVGINVEQDDGNGGFVIEPDNTIVYAYHTYGRTIGTSTVTDGVSDYTELSSWQNGKTWFLKYELDGNNVIQNAWACQKYSFINEPVCLQGGNASYYTANRGIIEGLTSTFNSNGGSCPADDSSGYCLAGGLGVDAYSYGSVCATDYSSLENCLVDLNGHADCR